MQIIVNSSPDNHDFSWIRMNAKFISLIKICASKYYELALKAFFSRWAYKTQWHYYICIHNNQLENIIYEIIPFTIGTKSIKYSGIMLTTDVQSLYTENCQALLNSIKKS